MWDDLLRAMALMLVFEGMLPFVAPARWRNLVAGIGQMNDRALRTVGLVCMLSGLGLLYLVNRSLS